MANKEEVDVNINVNGADKLDDSLNDATSGAENANKEFGKMDSELSRVGKTLKGIGSAGGKALKGIGQVGASAFRAIGKAIAGAGIGLLIGVLGTLWEAVKRNQKIMDLFETAVNAVGIVIQPLAKGLADLIQGLVSGSEKFDALGKVIKNVVKLALKPFQLSIEALKISVATLMIAWEKLSAALSKKKELDEGRIAELQASIDESKQKMKELAVEAGESFTEIKNNVGEALQEIKEFGKGVIDETVAAVALVANGAAQAATDAKKNLETLARQQAAITSQYLKEAEVLRQIRDDVTKTFEERIEANRQLGALLAEQRQAETDIINQKIAEQEKILALDTNNLEAQNTLLDLKNELLDLDERITGQQSEQLKNINTLNKEKEALAQEEIERARSVADEIRRLQQEAAVAAMEDANEAALLKAEFDKENFERELEVRLANEEITQEELLRIRTAYGEQYALTVADINKKIEASDKELAAKEVEIARLKTKTKIDGAITAANSILGAANAVFGESKAAAIAETIITTYQSATSAFSALSGIPIVGPALGGIAAAAAVVAGIANVNKIRQQSKPDSKKVPVATVPNQNPQFATGGYVGGPSHSAGGVDVNLEGGEYIVNKSAMASPAGALVKDINESGSAQYATVQQVAAMINAIEVYVLESKITDKQKEVEVRESRLING